jgi:hypothetical protein
VRTLALTAAAVLAGLVVVLVLHAAAAAGSPGLHYAPCPGRTPAWASQLPAPLPSCLYPGG